MDLTTSCQGFHGLFSITTDEVMSSLIGVSLPIFSYLVTLLPDCKTSKIAKKNNLIIKIMKLKTGLSFTALSALFNIHRTSADRIFVKHIQQLNILLKNCTFWPFEINYTSIFTRIFKTTLSRNLYYN